jgi:magnesium transporter
MPTTHPPETAARHLVTRVPRADPDSLAGQVRETLARGPFEFADAVCLVDRERRFCGMVPLTTLLGAPADGRVGALAPAGGAVARPEDDQEHVATLAVRSGIAAVPVADAEHRFLGVVPPLALLRILRREHVEDLHRLAGIRRESEHARSALESPPARRLHDRLPWLLVGLGGSALSALVISRFSSALAANMAVAYFLPAIVYLADAIGTQTEAIAVRGLLYARRPSPGLLAGELRTGLLIGGVLGLLLMPIAYAITRDARLAGAVALTVVAASGLATTVGLGFPLLLSRLGSDPAFGSGPVATIVQDLVSIVIYFAVVSLVL